MIFRILPKSSIFALIYTLTRLAPPPRVQGKVHVSTENENYHNVSGSRSHPRDENTTARNMRKNMKDEIRLLVPGEISEIPSGLWRRSRHIPMPSVLPREEKEIKGRCVVMESVPWDARPRIFGSDHPECTPFPALHICTNRCTVTARRRVCTVQFNSFTA
jgi:hypothetical protein